MTDDDEPLRRVEDTPDAEWEAMLERRKKVAERRMRAHDAAVMRRMAKLRESE